MPNFDDKYFDLQVSSNWSGSGEFSCYGHLSTDVSTPEGGDYLGEGKVQYLARYHMGPPANTIANREPMLRGKIYLWFVILSLQSQGHVER